MAQEQKNRRYDELFPNLEEKAAAFDQIAAQFYEGNFGRMSKADLETLMFHLYIEQILKRSEQDFHTYGDFRLSKELGIPQSRVSSLKVKKQLQYPRNFNWREVFSEVSKNARYEQGKIKIQIPDINLYYEIKNAVEEAGGYIDVTLTPRLLQISPEYFLDLLVAISEDRTRDDLREALYKTLRKGNEDSRFLEEGPIGPKIAGVGRELAINTVSSVLSEMLKVAGLPAAIVNTIKNVNSVLSQILSQSK